MDTGHRQVEGSLFVGLEPQVGEVVVVGVDRVPHLLVRLDLGRDDRDPLVAQELLVPFEGLAAGVVPLGVAGHTLGDLAEAERPAGVEQHEQQVGDAFESVGWGHRRQSTAPAVGCPP